MTRMYLKKLCQDDFMSLNLLVQKIKVPHVDHKYSTGVDLKLMKALNMNRLDTSNRGLGSVTNSSIQQHHDEYEHIAYTHHNKK